MNEIRISLQDKEQQLLGSLTTAEQFKDFADAIDKLCSWENLYVITTVVEIITGKEILPGTPNDLGDLLSDLKGFFKKEFEEAGEDSVFWNPATWKVFDFIGDIQAASLGIDRDEPITWEDLFGRN